MKRKRRTHKPEFKAKVALTALQGDLTMAELVKKFGVHTNQISEWKKLLLDGAPDVFSGGSSKKVWRMPFRMQSSKHKSRWSTWNGSRYRQLSVISKMA